MKNKSKSTFATQLSCGLSATFKRRAAKPAKYLALIWVTIFASLIGTECAQAAPKRPRRNDGADSVDGYIIKRTDKGIIKIPRKQNFKFSGAEVDGQAQSPSQSVLGKRPTARPATLIPERQNFRNELFESAGF